jgi:hypothetical protein
MLAGLFKVFIGSFTKEKILFSGYRLQVWDTFSPGCILTRTAKEYHKREQDGNKKSEKEKGRSIGLAKRDNEDAMFYRAKSPEEPTTVRCLAWPNAKYRVDAQV